MSVSAAVYLPFPAIQNTSFILLNQSRFFLWTFILQGFYVSCSKSKGYSVDIAETIN